MDKNLAAKRSKEEISLILQEWEQSKLSKKVFCQQKQINYQTFIGWIVQRRNRESLSDRQFVPVQIDARPNMVFAEIHLSSSRKVILHSPVGSDFIQAVLKC